MKLRGIVVPIATPVTRDENIDKKGLQRLVTYLLDGGVHGIFVMGSMGRFAFFSDDEQALAIETVVQQVNGKIPVMAGVSDTGLKRIMPKIRACEKIGVDAISVLPPFYYKHPQDELVSFYESLAKETDLPIFIYNNPGLARNAPDIKTILALSQIRNIVGIKDSSQQFTTSFELIKAFAKNSDFSVLIGTESYCLEALSAGADGVNAGSHNLAPHLAVQLYNAVKEHRFDKARLFQDRLIELDSIYRLTNTLAGLEIVMAELGIFEKATLCPHAPIKDKKIKAKILEIARKHLKY